MDFCIFIKQPDVSKKSLYCTEQYLLALVNKLSKRLKWMLIIDDTSSVEGGLCMWCQNTRRSERVCAKMLLALVGLAGCTLYNLLDYG